MVQNKAKGVNTQWVYSQGVIQKETLRRGVCSPLGTSTTNGPNLENPKINRLALGNTEVEVWGPMGLHLNLLGSLLKILFVSKEPVYRLFKGVWKMNPPSDSKTSGSRLASHLGGPLSAKAKRKA